LGYSIWIANRNIKSTPRAVARVNPNEAALATARGTDSESLAAPTRKGEHHERSLARPALRRANIVEEAGIHIDCRARRRAGHWRRHDHLQRSGRDYVAAFFVPEPETIDDALRAQAGSGDRARFGVAGQCDRARRAIEDAAGSGRHAQSRLHLDGRRAA